MDTVINDIKIPYHVGIILDGNGRWAQKRNLPRSQGHLKGLENLKNLLPYIYKRGVKIISIYAFSIENFKRSKEEVDFLMNIFVEKLPKELKTLMDNDIKIVFSSDISVLPSNVVKVIEDITYKTKDNKSGILNICLGYSSRQEILEATKKISNDILNNKINISDINEELFNHELIKIALQETAPVLSEFELTELAVKLGADVVTVIGKKIVLYKHSEKKNIKHVLA